MNTISMAAAAVIGSRHLRASRNGQDAVATWTGDDGRSDDGRSNEGRPHDGRPDEGRDGGAYGRAQGCAAVVVADGCGSGASSEVGARLGAMLFARLLGARLLRGEPVDRVETWTAVRADTVAALADLLERMPGDRTRPVHDCLLFTIVAGAVTPNGAAVWALGDGAYSFGTTNVLGPFADNQPPYLGYDLLGDPRPAHFAVAPAGCDTIVIATDGACDLGEGLEQFASRKLVDHPDALRRRLALLARGKERIDWEARRVVRVPAALQDDCAVGVLRWRLPS